MSQSDNYWLNTRTPALTYGLRGVAYFAINVSGPGQDLHSGLFGRMVHEPMTDLIKLMSKLVDHDGHILIPGIEAMVPPPDENEMCVTLCPIFVFRKGAWGGRGVYEILFLASCTPRWIILLLTSQRQLVHRYDEPLTPSARTRLVLTGAQIALSDHKESVIMGRMRNPSLSLHGIQGAFSEPGCKTVIPSKVAGKFSLRCVLRGHATTPCINRCS